jgi:hypothetical protein
MIGAAKMAPWVKQDFPKSFKISVNKRAKGKNTNHILNISSYEYEMKG